MDKEKYKYKTASIKRFSTITDLNEAIRLGWIVEAKKMLLSGVIPNSESITLAIRNGWHKLFIQQLNQRGAPLTTEHLYLAIRYGHADIVEMILKKDIRPTEYHLLTSIAMNYKPIILLLLKYIQPTANTLKIAISVENKRLVRRLIEMGVKPNFMHLEIANALGNKGLLAILKEALNVV